MGLFPILPYFGSAWQCPTVIHQDGEVFTRRPAEVPNFVADACRWSGSGSLQDACAEGRLETQTVAFFFVEGVGHKIWIVFGECMNVNFRYTWTSWKLYNLSKAIVGWFPL